MNKEKEKEKEEEIKEIKEFKKICPTYNYIPTVIAARPRIIAIGDIHGDFELTLNCFKLAKLINEKNHWIGGDTCVVQIGDQIDRCRPTINQSCSCVDTTINDEDSDLKIMKFFTQLDTEARLVGGLVISLLGNHELMNISGNVDYVSYKGLVNYNKDKDKNNNINNNIKQGRIDAFSRGNEIANFIGCTRTSCIIIGSFLFAHAGILPEFLHEKENKEKEKENKEKLNNLNTRVRKWVLKLIDNKDNLYNIITGVNNNSLFWNRILGAIPPNQAISSNKQCRAYLKPVLKVLNIKSMVIGHTPQINNELEGINGTCDKSLWRIDNGASDAFSMMDPEYVKNKKKSNKRKPQVLEILDDDINKINILK